MMRHYERNGRSARAGDILLRPHVSARDEARWFSDEIAVDFPSVAALVGRIRQSFLGEDERPDPVRVRLRLSPSEARYGTSTMLQLDLPATCDGCGGRGETWGEPCPACAGSGRRELQRSLVVPVPAGVRDGARYSLSVDVSDDAPVHVEVTVSVR